PHHADDGLGIGQVSALHPGFQLVLTGRKDIEEFALVELLRAGDQAIRKPDLDDLRRVADHGMQDAGLRPTPGTIARLFEQLALRAGQTVLTRVELASRKLDHDLSHRITVLALHHEAPVGQQGDHHDGTRVHDIFSGGLTAIGQANNIAPNVQEAAVIDLLAAQRVFMQVLVLIAHSALLPAMPPSAHGATAQIAPDETWERQGQEDQHPDGDELPTLLG